MTKIEKKFRSLRIIAWLFKLGALISLLSGFVLFFAILFGGKIFLHLMQGNSPYLAYMEFGQTAGAFLILAAFLVNTLVLYAFSSTIHLFIDIEANTRRTAQLLGTMPARPSTDKTKTQEILPSETPSKTP